MTTQLGERGWALALEYLRARGKLSETVYLEQSQWRERPVGVREFILDARYLGLEGRVHPLLVDLAEHLEHLEVRDAFLNLGKGSGKTALSTWFLAYGVYLWECYRDPYRTFGLIPGDKVAVVNLSTGGKNAKQLIWNGLLHLFRRAPCFRDRFKPFDDGALEVYFHSGMLAMCGHSSSRAFEGFNVWRGVLDEANKLKDDSDRVVAEELYGVVKTQSLPRFPRHHKVLAVSSSVNDDDWLARKARPAIEEGEALPGPFSPVRTPASVAGVLSFRPEDFPQGQWRKGAVFAAIAPTWVVNPKLPFEAFVEELQTKPRAAADYGCKAPAAGEESYFKNPELARTGANHGRVHPFTAEGTFSDAFQPGPYSYHVHYDLAVKRDVCGIACAHFDPARDLVVVDWMLGVKAPPGGEVQIDAVRQLVYAMRDRGCNVAGVTYDGWQSTESIQILGRHGFNAALYSVDRTREAYDTLLEHMLTKRVDWYEYDEFYRNVKSLVVVGGKKVDHKPTGGKDVSDAVAAAVYHASKDRSPVPMIMG